LFPADWCISRKTSEAITFTNSSSSSRVSDSVSTFGLLSAREEAAENHFDPASHRRAFPLVFSAPAKTIAIRLLFAQLKFAR
jgi:hypothetical protein